MKNIPKMIIAVLMTSAFAAATVIAQVEGNQSNPGAINFSTTVPNSADLRYQSGAQNGATVTGSGVNSPLNRTITFSDVSPNAAVGSPPAGNQFLWAIVRLRVRSNTTYSINAFRDLTGNLPDAAGNAATGNFKSGDIGFGVGGIADGNRPRVDPTAQAGAIIQSSPAVFGNDPRNAPVSNGQPTFQATLFNVGKGTNANATTLVQGTRISLGGDTTSNSNYLVVAMTFAIKQQFYTTTTSTGPLTERLNIFVVTP